MYVWVVFVLFSGGVVGDVDELIAEVDCISYAMVVVSAMPDLSCCLLASCEGVSTLDVLDTFCC